MYGALSSLADGWDKSAINRYAGAVFMEPQNSTSPLFGLVEEGLEL